MAHIKKEPKSPLLSPKDRKPVWMIRVSNIPDPLSKVDVQAMFDKHGNVRQLTGVGENPPYTTYDVTMATDAERQKALIAFNGKPAPGHPTSKLMVTLIKPEDQLTNELERVSRMIKGIVEFKNDSEKDEILSNVVATNNSVQIRDLNNVVFSTLNHMHTKINEDGLTGTELKKRPETVEQLMKTSEMNGWIWKLEEQIEGRVEEFLPLLHEDLKDKYKRGEEVTEEKLQNMIFRNHPEVHLKAEVAAKLDLPDVNMQWLSLSPFTNEITEAKVKQMVKKFGTFEYVILQELTQMYQAALVKMKTVEMAEEVVLGLRKKPLGGENRPLKVSRYYGKIALNSYPLNNPELLKNPTLEEVQAQQGEKRGLEESECSNGTAPKRGNFRGRGRGGGDFSRGREGDMNRGGRGGGMNRGGRAGFRGRGRGGMDDTRGRGGGGRGGFSSSNQGDNRGRGRGSYSRGRGASDNRGRGSSDRGNRGGRGRGSQIGYTWSSDVYTDRYDGRYSGAQQDYADEYAQEEYRRGYYDNPYSTESQAYGQRDDYYQDSQQAPAYSRQDDYYQSSASSDYHSQQRQPTQQTRESYSQSLLPKPSAVLQDLQEKLLQQNLGFQSFSDSVTTGYSTQQQSYSTGSYGYQQNNGDQDSRGRFAGYHR